MLQASADRPPVMNQSIEKDSFVIRTVSTNKEKEAKGDLAETLKQSGASTAIIAMRQEK